MKRLNLSARATLAALVALPFALGASACELIANVDRSLIPSGGESGGPPLDSAGAGADLATGGSTPSGGGQTSSGGSTSGASGEAGDSQAAGAGGDSGGIGGGSGTGGAGAGAGAGGAGAGGAGAGGAGAGGAGAGGAGAGGAGAGAGGAGGAPSGKVIYVTSVPHQPAVGGVVGADAQCNTSPPTVGTYKALLVDGTTRVACTSAQCATGGAAEGVGWVLAPNTKYVREDGTTVIGTTSAAAIFVFPLTASFGTNSNSYWTGLNADWTTSADSCSGWTQTTTFFASEGVANTADSRAIHGAVSADCTTVPGASFACVEQ